MSSRLLRNHRCDTAPRQSARDRCIPLLPRQICPCEATHRHADPVLARNFDRAACQTAKPREKRRTTEQRHRGNSSSFFVLVLVLDQVPRTTDEHEDEEEWNSSLR